MSQEFADLTNRVRELHAGLDTFDYYAFLEVARTTDYVAIRDAFYARAQTYHPDRFLSQTDVALTDAVYAVYKRMTEAYNVLCDPELRRRYDEQLATGEVRLRPEDRSRRLDATERQLANPFARLYLRSGRQKLQEGRVASAWIDIELGLSLEDAGPLRDLREQLVRRMHAPQDLGQSAPTPLLQPGPGAQPRPEGLRSEASVSPLATKEFE